MFYKLWDKKESINGIKASHFLNEAPFKNYDGDIIIIYANASKTLATQVECKDILANAYGIDSTLSLDDFMTAYELAIKPKEKTTTETTTKTVK